MLKLLFAGHMGPLRPLKKYVITLNKATSTNSGSLQKEFKQMTNYRVTTYG